MILSDRDIRRQIELGSIVVRPIDDPSQIQPASIDLRLADRHIVRGPGGARRETSGELVLVPGSFAIASTIETVGVPAWLVAQVAGKSSLARRGVQVECAGWIDPGFNGQITLELANLGTDPISLSPGDRICQVIFMRLSSPCLRPYGHPELGSHYQGQTGPTEARAGVMRDSELEEMRRG